MEVFVLTTFLACLFLAPIVTIWFLVSTGRTLTRLNTFKEFASVPGRQLLADSGIMSASQSVTFSQGSHRLHLSYFDAPRADGSRVLECRLFINANLPQWFLLEVSTNDFRNEDRGEDVSARIANEVLHVHDPDVENRFTFASSDPGRAKTMFDAQFLLAIRQLDALFNQPGAFLAMTFRMIVIRKVCTIRKSTDLEHLFQVACTLFNGILERIDAPPLLSAATARRSSAIVPAGTGRPALGGARGAAIIRDISCPDDVKLLEAGRDESRGTCQICGDVLAVDIVRCTTCGTPHHRDCWEYNGRCSTFGCAGLRATASR